MVAHVLEVVARAVVARHARLPARVVRRGHRAVEHQRHGLGVGHVGEPQAFGGELHLRHLHVHQRAAISAHAVVVRDAGRDVHRQRAAPRRRGEIGNAGVQALAELRQAPGKEFVGPLLAGEAKHRRLLRDLAPAAVRREAYVLPQAPQLELDLALDLLAKPGVCDRVVHVGEHEVLPHEDAELVAQAIELVGFVDHGPADPKHVEAGVAGERERLAQLHRVAAQGEEVGGGPARAAREDREPVHDEADLATGRVEGDILEANVAAVDRVPFAVDRQLDAAGVKRRRAMGVGKPERRIGDRDVALDDTGKAFEREDVVAHADLRFLDRTAQRLDLGANLQAPRAGLGECLHLEGLHRDRVEAFELDRLPGAHAGDGRRPAGHAPEERGADPAQVLLVHQRRLPARARTALLQLAVERTEHDRELVHVHQEVGHVDALGDEHVARGRDLRAVQPHLGQGGEAVEAQAIARSGRAVGPRESRSIPPVVGVVVALGVDVIVKGRGNGAGHNGVMPLRGKADQRLGRIARLRRRVRELPAVGEADRPIHSGSAGASCRPPTARPWRRAG